METDHDDDAARLETFVKDTAHGRFELPQLVIDRNAQRLKDTRCRMPGPAFGPITAARYLISRRLLARGRGGEVASRSNRLPRAPRDDVTRHAPTVRLFAVTLKDVAQRLFIQARDKVSGRLALLRIETQIERAFGRKAEAAFFVGQLIGRQPEVEQNAIDGRNLQFGEDLWKLRITGLVEMAMKARELKGRNFQHLGVAVKTD